ncbi:LOW QUALITY PROTEIN: Reverse transcriptase, partial [Phytophthora palmivora]
DLYYPKRRFFSKDQPPLFGRAILWAAKCSPTSPQRESKSPHSTSTFCVRKPNGKWRLVHAYNKLNNATVPAQTPIPRKDVLLNNMSGCTLRAEDGQTTMEVHLKHLCRVFEVLRASNLYASIDKCVFSAEEIKDLGCFGRRTRRSREGQGHSGLADPEVAEGPPEVQAPVLALPDENKSFSVVCDASDYGIGCALLQKEFLSDGKDAKVDRLSPRQRTQLQRYELSDGYSITESTLEILLGLSFQTTRI